MCQEYVSENFDICNNKRQRPMSDRASAPFARIRTMEEFSVASGISRPTLSRFFNDPTSVRPASREKIEEAMERLGYRPNLLAVNFNRRNPKTLGILVPTDGSVLCRARAADRIAGLDSRLLDCHAK